MSNRYDKRTKYPWDDWFALKEFTVQRGKHYKVSQSAFAGMLRNAAHKRRLGLHLDDTGKGFTVHVYIPQEGKRGSRFGTPDQGEGSLGKEQHSILSN